MDVISRSCSGGAVYNGGVFAASRSTFSGNKVKAALPNPGPEGAFAQGGAIGNFGTAKIESCLFVSNESIGLRGAAGYDWVGTRGGMGSWALGGAFYNAKVAVLVNSTIVSNTCFGGGGGQGGDGPYSMHGIERVYLGPGGDGGNGGAALGSGIYSGTYAVSLMNCTLAYNVASAGLGGPGGGGSPPGSGGRDGVGTGAIQTKLETSGSSLLSNNLLATNSPGNCFNVLTDLGHNLSSDGSSAFTNSSSLVNTDPLLGRLANNGGPTLTMALLAGSPAIDAGDPAAAPTTDQRGFPRAFGAAADIGAYEFVPVLHITPALSGSFDLLGRDLSGPSCRLLASTNFLDWLPIATNPVSADETAIFPSNEYTGGQRFYRLIIP